MMETAAAFLDSSHTRRSTCRGCGGSQVEMVLSLGRVPLANSLPATPAEFADERRYPLDLYVCVDCCLVQLLDVVDPSVLFSHYLYTTGTSATMSDHNRLLARSVIEATGAGPDDLIIDIASNDGSLLKEVRRLGARVLGIEPASNLARLAEEEGIETVNRFFDSQVAEDVVRTHGPARAVTATNVLAHVDNTVDFLAGCRSLLADEGMLVVEVPWLRELIGRTEYDTIYHEHLCYYSVTAAKALFERHGLHLNKVEHLPIHGGSMRYYASPTAAPDPDGSVARFLAEESALGVDTYAYYAGFGERVRELKERLLDIVTEIKRGGGSIAGYGAAAKGAIMLNYVGLDDACLDFVVDRNTHKQGRYMPGVDLEILDPSVILERMPDYLLILPWNFKEEIMEQQSEYRGRGGRFIVPVPIPHIVANHPVHK